MSNKQEVIKCAPFNDDKMKIVDTTGAGDCFTAAFATMLAIGKPIPECLRFGCAAAFISITRKGALPSMPKLSEVQSFLLTHK